MFPDSNSRQAEGKHLFLAGEGKDGVEFIHLINCLLWASFVLDGLNLYSFDPDCFLKPYFRFRDD